MTAGADYLAALEKLGLDPEGLLWAYDQTLSEFVLVLVTGHFDFVGPTAIYETLTKAYDLASTPKAIPPFIVRLQSPQQAIVYGSMRTAYGWDVRMDPYTPDLPGLNIDFHLDAGDLTFRVDWVYHFCERKVARLSGRGAGVASRATSRSWRLRCREVSMTLGFGSRLRALDPSLASRCW